MKGLLKPWEVVLIVVGLFLVCSTSLYWYDRFNKTRIHTIEGEITAKWQKDTEAWQANMEQFRKDVFNLINANIAAGKLIVPQKEKK